MKRHLAGMFGMAVAGLLVLPAASAWAAEEIWVDDDFDATTPGWGVTHFNNLPGAITAADPTGTTIYVAPGNYPLFSQLDIAKEVTILGPMEDVDPRPSADTVRIPGHASEAVVNCAPGIRLLADNITINGLDFTGSGGNGDMIESISATPTSNINIKYNIIRDSWDEGIQLRNTTGSVIEYNFFWNTGITGPGDAVNICCGSTGNVIRSNDIINNGSVNAAIYIYNMEPTVTNLDLLIEGNVINGTNVNDAIKLGSGTSDDDATTGVTVRGNYITNTASSADAIAVRMSGVVIEDNYITNNNSENGVIYIYRGGDNITIQRNFIRNSALNCGKFSAQGGPGVVTINPPATGNNLVMRDNVFFNITCAGAGTVQGVLNMTGNVVDATNNWWGHRTGPSGGNLDPNTGDPADGQGMTVSDNVAFFPYNFIPGLPGPDSVGSGLSDIDEELLGTDPTKRDTSGNGMDDGLSARLGFDPLDPNDPDPSLPDTDGDGMPDFIDNDPNAIDSDGDRIKDAFEVTFGYDPDDPDNFPVWFGDANNDGNVDFIDALIIMQIHLGIIDINDLDIPWWHLDLNRNMNVDFVDSIILFNWVLDNVPYIPFP